MRCAYWALRQSTFGPSQVKEELRRFRSGDVGIWSVGNACRFTGRKMPGSVYGIIIPVSRVLWKRTNFGILNEINAVQFSCCDDPGFMIAAEAPVSRAQPTLHEADRHL
jgi:hypothetical protein